MYVKLYDNIFLIFLHTKKRAPRVERPGLTCYSAQVQPRQLFDFFRIFSRRHGASALNLLATAGVPLRSVRNSGGEEFAMFANEKI